MIDETTAERDPDEYEEAELRALLHAAAATVPADPPDSIRAIAPAPAPGRVRRTWWAIGAAAAAAVLVVGAVVLVTRPSSSDVVADREPAATTTGQNADRCSARAANVFVYFELTATPEQINAVRRALVADVGADGVEFFDHARSYEEFQRLFEGQPDMIATVRPEDLPESFGAVFPTAAAAAEWLDVQMPGVLRVELDPCLTGDSPVQGIPLGETGPLTETTTTQRP